MTICLFNVGGSAGEQGVLRLVQLSLTIWPGCAVADGLNLSFLSVIGLHNEMSCSGKLAPGLLTCRALLCSLGLLKHGLVLRLCRSSQLSTSSLFPLCSAQ